MDYSLDTLRSLISRHWKRQRAGIPGLRLHGATAPNPRINTIYRPSLCLVAQGRKQVLLNDRVFAYDPSQYLIVTVDLPVTGCIVHAGPQRPYLGLGLDLDPALIADLLLALPADETDSRPAPGLAVSRLDDDLLDAMARLLQLLDRPADVAVMAPIIKREIHYRLLRGDQGAVIRSLATADSRLSRLGRVIEWIRAHYDEAVSIDELADKANMSATSFHRHFKAVTLMSPLQYRAQIRLQEARRLLLAKPRDVAAIGFQVGYDSPSQFSREYRRMFGLPPAADAARVRGQNAHSGRPALPRAHARAHVESAPPA
jgi:AraC-like DNA-binding protein